MIIEEVRRRACITLSYISQKDHKISLNVLETVQKVKYDTNPFKRYSKIFLHIFEMKILKTLIGNQNENRY